jgi:predicted MPP superfamily phosphohydrolase
MEEFLLGSPLGPNQTCPSQIAPKKELSARLKKEALIFECGTPPAYPGLVTKLVKNFPPRNWLPQLLYLTSKITSKRARKNATDFQINHKIIHLENLPKSLKGLKILHLSDLHLDLFPSFGESLKRFLSKNQSPLKGIELAMITGDIQERYTEPPNQTVLAFKKIIPQLPLPIVACLGNHDSMLLADQLSQLNHAPGLRILVNQQICFKTQGGHKIMVQGVDDPYYYKTHKFHKKNNESINIVLAHSPQVYKEAAHNGIDLCLSGHTHGGQIKIPALGAIINRAGVPKKYIEGLWHYHSLKGHTSRGVGCSSVPLRINCPPEISIIELN